MIKPDPESPRLTENDKKVLRRIIEHAKVPDSDIAVTIGISPQAVFKIRNKLERLGIIKGYVPIIDFKKIGINVMVFIIVGLTPETWTKYSDSDISERIRRIPHLIGAYRVADVRATHILLLGFRDTYEKERYIAHLQTKMARQLQIMQIYTFSVDKIIVQNPLSLLYQIVNGKDAPVHEFLPRDQRQAQ
jgi:DNA-binding Lrp family transcriptional regulator